MRDYGIVSPKFWTGETGKSLRTDRDGQVLALYLMTSPHSCMTGAFYCPVMYMGHETGLGIEGATKALQRLLEGGFCEYDEASEWIFVTRMASFQIGEELKPNDNRVGGLKKEMAKMPDRIRARFLAVYGVPYGLTFISPSEAPCKPLPSQDQDQDQDQDQNQKQEGRRRATRLPADWQPRPEQLRWARDARPDVDANGEASKFRDFWIAKPGRDGTKLDWEATWRNWIRNSHHGSPKSTVIDGGDGGLAKRKRLGEGSSTDYGVPGIGRQGGEA